MNVVIIKYQAGNLQSVETALRRQGVEPLVTNNWELIKKADRVILPGVGEARMAMESLKTHRLHELIPRLRMPVLGICIGLQLFCEYSEESDTDCLGIYDARVLKFKPKDSSIKVPQMGWNKIIYDAHPLFYSLPNDYVYYVNSYAATITDHTIATTTHGDQFSGAFQKDNFYAVQFHPEKSGETGEQILRNFLDIDS